MSYKFILSVKRFLTCKESAMNDNDPQPIKLPQALLKTHTAGVKSSHML